MFNSRTRSILQTIFIFLFIMKISYAHMVVEPTNDYVKFMLAENEEQIILKIKEAKKQIMAIDFLFTNPSKYDTITFNRYDVEDDNGSEKEPEKEKVEEEKENVEEENQADENEVVETRRLSTVYKENQTDLVIEDNVINGKKVVYLQLDEETKAIAFTIYLNKTKPLTNADFIYLRYRVADEKPGFYFLKNSRVKAEVQKDIVNVSFSGISQFEGVSNDENFNVQYIIRFFDKEEIDTYIEKAYAYFLLHSINVLGSVSFELGGKSAAENINVRVKGSLNDKKPQYALVYAIANYKGEKEYILYSTPGFSITESSQDNSKVKDDDKKKDDDKGEKKEGDNVEKNQTTFYIILGAFIGIVIIVFIIIMVYISMKPKNQNPEDSGEYKNVGAIRNVNEEEN